MPDAGNATMGLLDVNDSLLLVVDMQSRLLAAMKPLLAKTALENSVKLLTAADLLKVPVLLTEQYPKGLGDTTEAINAALPAFTQRFEKTAFSCCGNAAFNQALLASGCKQIIVIGQEAHVCVLQTAIELMAQGFQVYVVEDAVLSRHEQHKANALQRLQALGIAVTNHESVLFEWLRDAKHAQFKAISALVR
jgi:nicotinamidase-related amidase